MAEIIARNIFIENNILAEIKSAGLFVNNISGMSENACLALKELLNLRSCKINHTAKLITQEIVLNHDLILAMTNSHKNILKNKFEKYKSKIFTLAEFACEKNYDITDPFGCDLNIYNQCAREIYYFINLISKKDLLKTKFDHEEQK